MKRGTSSKINKAIILKKIKENKEKLKEKGVQKMGIFGSYARGKQTNKSDVDVLIKVKKDLSLFDLIRIKMDLEKLLKKKVDLVEYNTIKPIIKKQILAEEVRIL